MSDLSKQIAELKAKQVEILNEQLKEKVSLIKPLDNPSIESIIQFAKDYAKDYIENGNPSEDFDDYALETIVISIYGRDFYDKMREIKRIKLEIKQNQ